MTLLSYSQYRTQCFKDYTYIYDFFFLISISKSTVLTWISFIPGETNKQTNTSKLLDRESALGGKFPQLKYFRKIKSWSGRVGILILYISQTGHKVVKGVPECPERQQGSQQVGRTQEATVICSVCSTFLDLFKSIYENISWCWITSLIPYIHVYSCIEQ